MKILKIYDKINRNVFHHDINTGNITIREFCDNNKICTLFINTKLFKSKNEKMAYFSYVEAENNVVTKTLDITRKYILFRLMNQDGLLIHSERTHLKDSKSFLLIDRIYDDIGDFIEIENHHGNKTMKFTVKKEIINQLLNDK